MDFTAEKPWERILGDDTIKRVEFTAQSATEYRRNAHLPAVDSEIQALHNQYIHELGADFLRAKLAYNKEKELEKEKLIRKQAKVGKVLRRKIKVSDLEDGGVAITIDQEWDTSTWSKEQIEAGCEALVMVFYEDEKKTSLERKERAVQMLQKLLSRHTVAITYLRQSIEMIIGKSVSKLIIQGQTCAILNLLFILHSSKDIYQEELSQYTFCVRAIEMLLQEARLAAILIQHTFRAYSNRMRKVDYSSQNTGFGTEMEIKMSKILLVNARSAALRSRWRSMHNRYPAAERAIVGGIRGPIYIKSMFIIKAIEIVLYLVAPAMGKRAPGNREDVVRANGCILLSYFIGCPTSPYSYMSTELLAYITKVPESFYRAMHSGCIHSCLRLLKYLRMIGVGSFNLKEKKNDIYTPTRTYLHCVDTIINSAVHAAGIYRGLKGYRFVKQAEAEVERVDYCAEYRHIYKNEDAFHRDVRQLLVFPNLLKEVAHVIISTQNFTILKKLLQCVFAVSCTSGHSAVHSEVIAWAGTLMVKLIDLLHNDSDDIGTLALSIFLQQCVDSVCRQSLIHMNIAFNLSPLNKIYVQEYGNLKHQRSLLAGIALCRQCNWRYYDPQELPKVLAADGSLRKSIFLDLLKTMKNPDDAIVEELSIADLVVLPNDTKTTLELSKVVKSFNAKEITNFLSHPDDPWYYESLPIEEACAVCTIIEGLSADKETARIIYSPGVVNYLGKFLFLAKYLFMGKPMLDSVIVLLLSGVKSITAALGQLAIACRSSHSMAVEYIDVVHNCDLISSGLFFLETLTVAHEKVDASTKELQKLVGLACLDYFSGYASMIIDTLGPQAREAEDLHTMGKAVINVSVFFL